VISCSVSGVADYSVLVGCDAVPDVSKGRAASIFRVKYVTGCVLEGDAGLMLFDFEYLHDYCTRELDFSSFTSGKR